MPVCLKCGRMAATAEMRRSPKEGNLCKDKLLCKARAKERAVVDKLVKSVPPNWKEL